MENIKSPHDLLPIVRPLETTVYPDNTFFYENVVKKLIPDIMNAYEKLDKAYDVVVIEGAGSPAEINLKKNDIVNMGMAKLVDAPVLLVGDIDRGGVFAQLVGTIMLLEEEEKISHIRSKDYLKKQKEFFQNFNDKIPSIYI